MADQREHWCRCGRWASFGKRDPLDGHTDWACGMRNGAPHCPHQPERVVPAPDPAATPGAAIATMAERPAPDLFGGL